MDTSYYVDTYYGYNAASQQAIVGNMFVMMIILCIISFALSIFMIICMWKVFTKLGKPGWAALIPFYNIYVMCKIVGKAWWHVLLFLVPVANIYAMFVLYDGIAKKFGKTTGFTIGMMFLPFVFFAILAFSKNEPSVNTDEKISETTTDSSQSALNATLNQNVNNAYVTSTTSNDALEKTQINIGQNYQTPNVNDNFTVPQSNYQTMSNNAFNQSQSVMQGANDFSSSVENQANNFTGQNDGYGANIVNNIHEINAMNNTNPFINNNVANNNVQALDQNVNLINNNHQEPSQPVLENQNFNETKIMNQSDNFQNVNTGFVNNDVENLDLSIEESSQQNVVQSQNEKINASGYEAPIFDVPKESTNQPSISSINTQQQPIIPTTDDIAQNLNNLNQNVNYGNNENPTQANVTADTSNKRTSLWVNHNQNNQ